MNADEVERRIESLDLLVDDAVDGDASWREVWDEIREIRAAFKDRDLRFPTREQRQEAWEDLQAIVDRVQEHRAKREADSAEARDELMSSLDAIYLPMGGVGSAVVNLVSGMFESVLAPGMQREDTPEERLLKQASSDLKDVRERFHELKSEMLRDDKNAVWARMQEIQDQLNEMWSEWREAVSEARRERLENAKERKEQRLSKLREIRGRIEENLENNREKLADATSDSYRERVEGWIEEDEERLEEIDDQIREVESAIEDIQDKIDDLD